MMITPHAWTRLFWRPRRRRSWTRRRGAVLAVFALIIVVLLGMVGIVVDAAILTATHRQAQNAADAAALAAAMDRMRSRTTTEATATATTFVQTYNGLTNAPAPTVNFPPATGPYAGRNDYVEVIVSAPVQTYLVHIVGVARNQQVQARAVAGFEAHSSGDGVMVLNPDARPGLSVSGGGRLRVNGDVTVNSEGGGVDENNVAVNNGNSGVAASGGSQPDPNTGLFAINIDVVGGVDKPANFKPYDVGGPQPLHAKQLPKPDSLISLPTPVSAANVDGGTGSNNIASGVDATPTSRGDVAVTNNSASGLGNYAGPGVDVNFKSNSGGEPVPGRTTPAAAGEVILFPGIYGSLSITGGNVYLVPGIYVLSPTKQTTTALKITSGTVTAEHVLFYNTAVSYNHTNGQPDVGDTEDKTPLPNTDYAGGFTINAGMKFSPINTSLVNYSALYSGAPRVSPAFDGMLFFQRRRHQASIDIQGNSSSGLLTGTLYAKWSNFKIAGSGTYDAQFIAGSLDVAGQGDITILSAGEGKGKANQIYLVE